MCKQLKHIAIIGIAVVLLTTCQKNKIECETDAECEQMLVGTWEDSRLFSSPPTRIKFYTSRKYELLESEKDSAGNQIWEPREVIQADSLYYEVQDLTLYIRYGGGKYNDSLKSKQKIKHLTSSKLILAPDQKHKRIK
jgi:hypothetical protein